MSGLKGTSRHAVPSAQKSLVKSSKKQHVQFDQLKFIKVRDGSAHLSTSFPPNFVSSEWLVYRNNRPLTNDELATLVEERSSASVNHKQMIISKIKAFGKIMNKFCAIRDTRNSLFTDAQGVCSWPIPQRPLNKFESDYLRETSPRFISAFTALEQAALTFSTVEVSRLIYNQSADMQAQIAEFSSHLPESIQRLFGQCSNVGDDQASSSATQFSSHSFASPPLSPSTPSVSSVSGPKSKRFVQANKNQGGMEISVNASEVASPTSSNDGDGDSEAFTASANFESVSVRLTKSTDEVNKYKERHGAAVEVEASKEEPCPKLTHKKYTLLRLCPMRKNDFSVIDTTNHAPAFVLIREGKNERIVQAHRCHICALPSHWHLQSPACSVPVEQREDLDGFCSSCGYDINHLEHDKNNAQSKQIEQARKVEMKKKQEKRKIDESSSVVAEQAQQEEKSSSSSSAPRRSQRNIKKKMPPTIPEVAKPTKRRRRSSKNKNSRVEEQEDEEEESSKPVSDADTASPTVVPTIAFPSPSSVSSSTTSSSTSSVSQASSSSHNDDEMEEEAVDYEGYDEENINLAPDSERVPRMSMLRGSRSATPLTSTNSSAPCPYSIEDLALTHAIQCNLCGKGVAEHLRKQNLLSSKSPKIPKESELPVFKDPAKKEMADPEIFVQRFEERIAFFEGISVSLKKMCFRRSLTEKHLYDWASTCIEQAMPWVTMKLEFIKLTTDPVVAEQRKRELKERRQKSNESVFKYTSDFIHLAARLQRSVTDQHLIEHLYDGLLPNVRKQVTFQRNVQAIAAGLEPTRTFSSLKEVADAAVMAERVLKQGNVDDGRTATPRTSTTKSGKRKRSNKQSSHSPSVKQAKLNDGTSQVVTASVPTSSAAAVASARTVKLETRDGKPTNVNKKNKSKTVRFADPLTASAPGGVKSTRRCIMCGKEGHVTKNCFENKKLCRNCGEKEHTLANCPMPRQSICRVPVPSLASLIENGKENRRMLVTGPLLGSKPLLALYDTGAMFSGISARLCKRQNFKITSPTRGGDKIHGATHGMSTKRIGIVVIEVIIHYSNSTGKTAMKCTKEFEVLDLTDEHFIIGQDMSAELFPGESAWEFGAKWAEYMTTRPSDVTYLTPNRPRAATLNDSMSESKSESDGEDVDNARAKAIVSNSFFDDSDDDDDAHSVAALSTSETQDE